MCFLDTAITLPRQLNFFTLGDMSSYLICATVIAGQTPLDILNVSAQHKYLEMEKQLFLLLNLAFIRRQDVINVFIIRYKGGLGTWTWVGFITC